jgi:hypothetical protein
VVGLETWLHAPLEARRIVDKLKANVASLEALPAEVRKLLTRAASDPTGFSQGRREVRPPPRYSAITAPAPGAKQTRGEGIQQVSLSVLVELLQKPGNVIGFHPEGTRNNGDDPYHLLPAQPRGRGARACGVDPGHCVRSHSSRPLLRCLHLSMTMQACLSRQSSIRSAMSRPRSTGRSAAVLARPGAA